MQKIVIETIFRTASNNAMPDATPVASPMARAEFAPSPTATTKA